MLPIRRMLLVVALLAPITRADVPAALNALYESGENLKTLAADVSIRTTNDLGDDLTKTGRFVMQKLPDGDTRVRATFTQRKSGNKIFAEKRDYLLAGQNLIERDYVNKKQTTRQVRQPGQKLDLFKLGEGPFPLPIGQKPDDVLKEFDVKELPNRDDKILAVVELSPKPKTDLARKFKSITVAVDKATKLPAVITTVDPQETDTNEVRLTNPRTDGGVSDKEFDLEVIDESAWNLVGTK